ncbi:MAG: hypothetical protein L0G81_12650 [Ewingella sp.]|nr:hypothetical protein [Ewingella sp.]
MKIKWTISYRLKDVIIALNWMVLLVRFLSYGHDALYFLLIAMVISIIPMLYGGNIKLLIIEKGLEREFLDDLFFRKSMMAIATTTPLLAWAWWGGNIYILAVGIASSFVGTIVFWCVGSDALAAKLPELYVKESVRYSGCDVTPNVDAGMKQNRQIENDVYGTPRVIESSYVTNHSTETYQHATVENYGVYPGVNPASGLQMINDSIDIAGNPYGSDSLGTDNR